MAATSSPALLQASNSNGVIKEMLNLFENRGAVLLRGVEFDLRSFEEFSQVICPRFHIPATRKQRRQQLGDGFSTEVYRDNYTLLGHAEGAYKPYPAFPEMAFFLCVVPPAEKGGETTVIDGAEFYKRIPETIRKEFIERGVTYEMTWEKERWQHEFEVDDVDSLIRLLASLPATRYTIHEDVLHLFYTTRAITHDRHNHLVFANAMLAHLSHITHPSYADKRAYCRPTNRVYWGNGDVISDEVINKLIDIHDAISYAHRWQKNDLLVLDNTRYMHGRNMTEKDCERVLLSRFGWCK